jgi:hypothetical protein
MLLAVDMARNLDYVIAEPLNASMLRHREDTGQHDFHYFFIPHEHS